MTTISIRIAEPGRLTRTDAQTTTAAGPSLWVRFTCWLCSMWCLINGGHYKVLHTDPDRIALRCVACGHTSPGWEVGTPRFARRMPADKERLRMRRPMAA